jgi:hypothetical protein
VADGCIEGTGANVLALAERPVKKTSRTLTVDIRQNVRRVSRTGPRRTRTSHFIVASMRPSADAA